MARQEQETVLEIVNGTGSVDMRFRAVALLAWRTGRGRGGVGPRPLSTQALLTWLFALFGYRLPEGSAELWHSTVRLRRGETLLPGDVCFSLSRTARGRKIDSVHVHIGKGQMLGVSGRLRPQLEIVTAQGLAGRSGVFRRLITDADGRRVVLAPHVPGRSDAPPRLSTPLRRGSKGGAVIAIQRRLAMKERTGTYDAETERLVRAFQESTSSLLPTGRVEPEDYHCIIHTRPLVMSREAAPKNWTMVLQRALELPQTGVFDEDLEAAVADLQRGAGLSPDGIVSEKVWALIEEVR